MGLFGTSGVRGIVSSEVTLDIANRLGLALAMELGGGTVALARDTRLSGPSIESATAAGLASGGAEVVRLGVIPTPTLAFATSAMRWSAGVMITASHNPPEYNGIKFFGGDGMAFTEERERKLESLCETERFDLPPWDEFGGLSARDVSDLYVEHVQRKIKFGKRWCVVLDPGGGASYEIAPRLFRSVGLQVLSINDRPDGRFLARPPEPSYEALRGLSRLVAAKGADVGIAFDGDADRFAVVDGSGRYVPMDTALAAYAGHISRGRGGVVVVPMDTSMAVEEVVTANGGEVAYCKVGDVSVAQLVRARNASFGGEASGAWINPDFHPCPDGMLSALLFLLAAEQEGLGIHDFVAKVPAYVIERAKVPCKNTAKRAAMSLVRQGFSKVASDIIRVRELDGLRVDMKSGWFLIRASGTEPALRITVEAKDQTAARELMYRLLRMVTEIVRKAT